MKTEMVLELRDVYGGDGEMRMEKEQEIKLRRTKKRTEMRSDIGLQVSGDETEEQALHVIEKQIRTFRRDEHGVPLMRLGGSHGKIYGAFKDTAKTLRMIGVSPFKNGYYGILNSIVITPIWVSLEENGGKKTRIEEIPQILAGARKAMIVQKYDVIPECTVRMTLMYPDAMHDAVEKMARGLENTAMLNKRRATCKILSMTST
jgi:hypothetical protein